MEVAKNETATESTSSSERPDTQTQLDEIRPSLGRKLQEGETWYLDVRWMKQWKKYVGFDTWDRSEVGEESANPGPIDNSNLIPSSKFVPA